MFSLPFAIRCRHEAFQKDRKEKRIQGAQMSKRTSLDAKPYAVVFKWEDAKPNVLDVREYFWTIEEARAYLKRFKGKLPKGVEYAEIMEWK